MATTRALLGAIVTTLLGTSALLAEIPKSRIYSRPVLPSTRDLRRLNLVQHWRITVPMNGQRDPLLIVEPDGRDLVILTASGMVMLVDAETGVSRWRTRVGVPYTLAPYYASNSRSLYVAANAIAHGLDRRTGSKKWEYRVRAGI